MDDCGSDLGPFESVAWTATLGADGSLDAARKSSFDIIDCGSSTVESSEGEFERVLEHNFGLHLASRSGGFDVHHRAGHVPIEQFVGHLQQPKLAGLLDVIGIFGGFGGVDEIAVRRRLRSSEGFDLAAGFDVCKPEHQTHVLKYIERHKFLVIMLAPSCISFGHCAHLNRVLHPATWRESRRIGEILASFAARIWRLQIVAGRHFSLENPAGNGIFGLDIFNGFGSPGKWCHQCTTVCIRLCGRWATHLQKKKKKTPHFGFLLPFC